MKGNEMGGACSMLWRDEKSYEIMVGKPNRRDHPEDLGVDGRLILVWGADETSDSIKDRDLLD
jgi:hypothetical protein